MFVSTRGYPLIPANMKKIGRYPHNGYPTNMNTNTERIFIQQVGYEEATTRILTVPLTSLVMTKILSSSTLKFVFVFE